jgi:hypothetical protein
MHRRAFIACMLGGVAAVVAGGTADADPIDRPQVNAQTADPSKTVDGTEMTDFGGRRRRRRRWSFRSRRRWGSRFRRRSRRRERVVGSSETQPLPNSPSAASMPPIRTAPRRRPRLRFD